MSRRGGRGAGPDALGRGVARFNAGRFSEALACFETAVAEGGRSPRALAFLGHACEAVGQASRARRLLQEAAARGRSPGSALALAGLLRRQGREGEAAAVLRAALARSPRHRGLGRGLAALLARRAMRLKDAGRLGEARRLLGLALRRDPRQPDARELQGLLRSRAGLLKAVRSAPEPAAPAGPSPLRRRAEELLAAQRWPQARRALAALHRRTRGRGAEASWAVEALRRDARRLEGLGRLDEAAGAWELVSRLEPGSFEAWRRLQEIAGRKALEAPGRPPQARVRALMRRLISRTAGLGRRGGEELRAVRFRALFSLGRFAEAFAEGERILAEGVGPRAFQEFWYPWHLSFRERRQADLEALSRLARAGRHRPWAFLYLGILDRSAASLDSALRGAPARYGWMAARIGHIHLLEDRLDRAVPMLERASREVPAEWLVPACLAEASLCLKRPDEAWARMDRALSLAPAEQKAAVLAWRGELKLWLGRYREALEDLDEACALGGTEARFAYAWRGGAKLLLGRPEEALLDIDRGLGLHPGDREAHLWRGETLRALGRHEEALAELSRPPVGMWDLINRGLAKAALGDEEGLREDFLALPGPVRDFLLGPSPQPPGAAQGRRRLQAALEAALARARGFRREEPYGRRIWMS